MSTFNNATEGRETNQEKPTPDPICISFFKHIKSKNFLDKYPVTCCVSTEKTKSILIVSVNMCFSNKERFDYKGNQKLPSNQNVQQVLTGRQASRMVNLWRS